MHHYVCLPVYLYIRQSHDSYRTAQNRAICLNQPLMVSNFSFIIFDCCSSTCFFFLYLSRIAANVLLSFSIIGFTILRIFNGFCSINLSGKTSNSTLVCRVCVNVFTFLVSLWIEFTEALRPSNVSCNNSTVLSNFSI